MTDQQYPAVLMFGMPGVGKGTQGKLLGKIRGIFHLSTGDIFRSLSEDTEQDRTVADCLRRGQLVPDELTVHIWKHWLDGQVTAGHFHSQEQVLLLDGIPRNRRQCEMLEDHLRVLQVIHLNNPSEEPIVQRLRQRALIEGRCDDAHENIIRQRFEIYRRQTKPVLDYYSRDLIQDIDPIGTPAEVLKRILENLVPVIVRSRGSPPDSFDDDQPSPDDVE